MEGPEINDVASEEFLLFKVEKLTYYLLIIMPVQEERISVRGEGILHKPMNEDIGAYSHSDQLAGFSCSRLPHQN